MLKEKNKNGLIFFFSALLLLIIILFVVTSNKTNTKNNIADTSKKETVNGMIMLIESKKIEGILQWEKELDSRGLTALIQVQENVLREYPEVFKRLADKGYKVAGIYAKGAFWGLSYEKQYEYIKEAKDLVEGITEKKMEVIGSAYFAYDENTLKAAEALDVDYVLGRGINDVNAMIYKPEEYNVKIISVSNVDVGAEMGRGSLCDYSLWARGSGAIDFGEMVDASIAKAPQSMVLVSHAYLGGTRLEWWNEYKQALDSDKIKWAGFDQWISKQEIKTMANADIAINDEVKYGTPKPVKEIEDYEAIPGFAVDSKNTRDVTGEDDILCQ